MSVQIKLGEEYPVKNHSQGIRKGGDTWELFVIPDSGEKGRKEAKIWASNAPTGYNDGDHIRIKTINSAKWGARTYKEKWFDEFVLDCELEIVPVKIEENPFEEAENPTEGGDNPFDGELPF